MDGSRSDHVSVGLVLRLLAPYLSVLVFWVMLRSAWLAILGYHLQIILWLWLRRVEVRGFAPARLYALALPSVLAGPVVYFLLPRVTAVGVGPWLASHGIAGSPLAILVYFGLIHPPLEQLHWAPLRRRTRWAHLLFAGYHVIVLASLLPPLWLAVAFCVLVVASWMWHELRERSGGVAVPILSHVLADSSIAAAAALMARASS